jgi:hypothetical protein
MSGRRLSGQHVVLMRRRGTARALALMSLFSLTAAGGFLWFSGLPFRVSPGTVSGHPGLAVGPVAVAQAQGGVTSEQVKEAIRRGQQFLKRSQNADGSWGGLMFTREAISPLVTLALLESGLTTADPAVSRALAYLRRVDPTQLHQWCTYVTALHTMALAAAGPLERDLPLIQRNARALEAIQVPSGPNRGAWTYGAVLGDFGPWDNSNTQFAILGLHAAAEAGVQIDPRVWIRARNHFLACQSKDGGWGYSAIGSSYGSMTVAGIASLIITGMNLQQSRERLEGSQILGCGQVSRDVALERGLQWVGRNSGISIGPGGQVLSIRNPGNNSWTFYYLYGLERAGRLSGQRFFGRHDWYREGAEWLVSVQDRFTGAWQSGLESELLATPFALLFLSKGLSPVLINHLRYPSKDPKYPQDWNNDPDGVANLTKHVGALWKHRLTWQIVDIEYVRATDLFQAPVLFLSGHYGPALNENHKAVLREYIQQGGFLFAEACCGRKEFDTEFRRLVEELFPEGKLRPLTEGHAVWRSQYPLEPDDSLWGLDLGCRTPIIYSTRDLSCYWENPKWPESVRAFRVATNIIAYATGRELPPDKLSVRVPLKLSDVDPEARDTLRIAKLRHSGDWNAAPWAIPNLMSSIRQKFGLKVVLRHEPIGPTDPNLYRFPFLYMHGRNRFSFQPDELQALRGYLLRGGTLLADACCAAEPFDQAFREFVRQLFPDRSLQDIPLDDPLFSAQFGYDLQQVRYTRAMSQREGPPRLEGIRIDDRWVIVYSRWDIGCALERHQGSDCRGYIPEDAEKIATNVIFYALNR